MNIKEKVKKLSVIVVSIVCITILCAMYIPYLALLLAILAVLIPAAIIMYPFICAESFLKKQERKKKLKTQDELWKKFKNGEIDEDEYEYEMEFYN